MTTLSYVLCVAEHPRYKDVYEIQSAETGTRHTYSRICLEIETTNYDSPITGFIPQYFKHCIHLNSDRAPCTSTPISLAQFIRLPKNRKDVC